MTKKEGAKPIVLAEVRRSRATPDDGDRTWLKAALCDDRERPLPVLANVMLALREAPEISEAFGYDEMLHAAILTSDLPVVDGAVPTVLDEPRPVRDNDVTQLQEWLQHAGLPKIGKEIVHQAVDLRAQERAFHPVREWLSSLTWDGDARLDGWLSTYLGVEASAYAAQIGAMFLTSTVARIYQPGVKSDYMMILEGPQGSRKSEVCRRLGGAWFSDSLPDVATGGKDLAQHIRGKWIIEIGELSAMSKAESEALKAFVTRTVERYRPPYGRREVVEPRQAVFVGTTNRTAYLRDETGGRRFWPVKVGKIEIDKLSADRDQLFAEAVHRYRSGAQWWPDSAFEAEHIRPEQEARFEADPWQETIARYVEGRPEVTVGEIAKGGLFIDTGRLATADGRRITACLELLGWKRGKKDWRGRIPWARIS